jgi:uncharacterized phage infection (PIP) family protein YhgE
MAGSNTISLGFKVTGEDDMKRALADINNSLKVSSSEMALATAQYGNNEKSVDALNAKDKVLISTISEQNEKVNALKTAIQNAASAHTAAGQQIDSLKTKLIEAKAKMAEMGTSSDTTKAQLKEQALAVQSLEKELSQAEKVYTTTGKSETNYETQLNNAKASVIKMNQELENNQKALTKAQTGNRSVADSINGLASAAGINVPPALQGMVNKLDGVNASAAALVGTLAGVAVGLGKLTESTASAADDITTLSKVTGMSTDTIQELNYSAGLLDVSTETISGSLSKMIKNMNSSKKETSSQAKAFKELGVSVVDTHHNLRDANDIFLRTIDRLGKVTNETERDALSMTIFGKSAKELNPLIEAGSGKLKDYAKEAQNVGAVMDTKTLESFNELKDANDRLTGQWTAIKIQLAEVLLPVLTKITEAINKIPTSTLVAITEGIAAIAIIGLVVSAISPLIIQMQLVQTTAAVSALAAGTSVAAGAGIAGAGLTALLPTIGLVVLAIGGIAVVGYELVNHWGEITESISNGWNGVKNAFQSFGNWYANGFVSEWNRVTNSLKSVFMAVANGIATAAVIPINAVIATVNGLISLIDTAISAIDRIKVTLPGFMGGGTLGFSIPEIGKLDYISVPRYATGTSYHPGGKALVGENGPEVVDLPQGSKVYPNGVIPTGSYVFTGNIVIDAHNVKEWNDVLKYAQKYAQTMVQKG